jgi:hypothetical protein
MSPLSYAVITPSFRLDLERCRLLSDSVTRYVAPHVRHYIIVDRRDVAMFKPLVTPRTTLLVVEDIVPPWMFRVPGIRRFWFSLRTRPLKNWILQQIVKISVPSVVPDDVLLYTDSDTFFIAPFDPRSLERDGKVPLFVETRQRGLIRDNDKWHNVSADLLGLAKDAGYDTNYVGNVITWRRQTALKMREQIEATTGHRWELALAPLNAFSEYILYGMYAHRVVGATSGQWDDGTLRTLTYWRTNPLSVAQLRELKATQQPYHHSAMVSAKSRTLVEDIRKVFWEQ